MDHRLAAALRSKYLASLGLGAPPRRSDGTMVVCEICGSGSNSHLIANCTRCNAYEHSYCMQVLGYALPHGWYCADCQEYANGGPKSSQGAQTELQKSLHGCDMMKDRGAPKLCSNQSKLSPKSPNRFGNAKVKFISSEEAALLSRERPPYARSTFAVRGAGTKQSTSRSGTQVQTLNRCPTSSHGQTKTSNMKSVFPRSDMQVQALKRRATASHDQSQTKIVDRPDFAKQQSQVHPASPPHVKQLSNTKCISPNRIDMQVHATKRSAAASHDQAKIDDTNMRQEARFGDSARKKKIAIADNGETNSQVEDEPKEKVTLCASDDDTGHKSVTESLYQNKGVILTIDSSVGYSRRPVPAICWTGCFHVPGEKLNLGEFKAQFPSKVSSNVFDIVKLMPSNLQLELLPRMDDWPKVLETNCPGHEDIGLFFFSNEPGGCEKRHSYLLEACNNYVLRAYIYGIKLLIYSSEVLPPDSQWIDGENYLWGVFVRPKRKRDPR
ncbi:hypothetical protein U9M48_007692 [Paspalum notatum var. saurae]|uniref:AIPP2-like SPOC-like domain-containing protein n=1 Tax=Paspalum notatum var. saurae TaxID=547442 RepID=A0AAQ3SMW6_PASNO